MFDEKILYFSYLLITTGIIGIEKKGVIILMVLILLFIFIAKGNKSG